MEEFAREYYINQDYFIAILRDKGVKDYEEILSKATEKALVAIHTGKYEDRGNFKAWFVRIMKNAWIDECRRSIKCRTVELDKVNSSTSNQNRLAFDEVMQAVDDLHATKREILDLRSANYSYKEIAEKLNLSINTVSSTISLARKQLLKDIRIKDNV